MGQVTLEIILFIPNLYIPISIYVQTYLYVAIYIFMNIYSRQNTLVEDSAKKLKI